MAGLFTQPCRIFFCVWQLPVGVVLSVSGFFLFEYNIN